MCNMVGNPKREHGVLTGRLRVRLGFDQTEGLLASLRPLAAHIPNSRVPGAMPTLASLDP